MKRSKKLSVHQRGKTHNIGFIQPDPEYPGQKPRYVLRVESPSSEWMGGIYVGPNHAYTWDTYTCTSRNERSRVLRAWLDKHSHSNYCKVILRHRIVFN